jgi:hypothetical protein
VDSQQKKILEKYSKVRALAKSGVEGEKDNAKRIIAKMESENPWLKKAYAEQLRQEANAKEAQEAPPPPPQPPPPPPKSESTKRESTKRESTKPSPNRPDATPPEPEPHFGGGSRPGRTVDWQKIWDFANSVYAQAGEFVDTVTQAGLGQELAFEVKVKSKFTATGNLNMTLTIPPEIVDRLTGCNDIQLQVFRNYVMMQLQEELNNILDIQDTDDL